MTSQRLVEDFARYLFERDHGKPVPSNWRVPDYAMNEAAVFLGGELGQRLQHGDRDKLLRRIESLRSEKADLHEAYLAGRNVLLAKIEAVLALCDRAQTHDHDGFKMTYVSWIRKALEVAGEPLDLVCNEFQPPPGGGYVCQRCKREWREHAQAKEVWKLGGNAAEVTPELDLDAIRRRDDELGEALLPAPTTKTVSLAAFRTCANDRRDLLAEVDKLRDEITDRANVEADLRAQLATIKRLFAGGPDTPCRTTWRKDIHPMVPAVECVEVPMDELQRVLGSPP